MYPKSLRTPQTRVRACTCGPQESALRDAATAAAAARKANASKCDGRHQQHTQQLMNSMAKRSMARLARMHVDEGLLLQLGPEERRLLSQVHARGPVLRQPCTRSLHVCTCVAVHNCVSSRARSRLPPLLRCAVNVRVGVGAVGPSESAHEHFVTASLCVYACLGATAARSCCM